MNYRKIKRLKTLIPTLRERKRYFLIKIFCEKELKFEEIKNEILKTFLKLYGEIFSKLTSLKILENTYNESEKTLVLKCNVLAKHFVSFALGKINDINGKKVLIRILKISGTVKRLYK
jgi:ribonuclease P/MRP protein subunit POP5